MSFNSAPVWFFYVNTFINLSPSTKCFPLSFPFFNPGCTAIIMTGISLWPPKNSNSVSIVMRTEVSLLYWAKFSHSYWNWNYWNMQPEILWHSMATHPKLCWKLISESWYASGNSPFYYMFSILCLQVHTVLSLYLLLRSITNKLRRGHSFVTPCEWQNLIVDLDLPCLNFTNAAFCLAKLSITKGMLKKDSTVKTVSGEQTPKNPQNSELAVCLTLFWSVQ